MIEARIFVDDIEPARAILESLGAKNMGHFRFLDTIYKSLDTNVSLGEEFLRLRYVPERLA